MHYRTSELLEQLKGHEGLELYPYTDTTGHLTIGVGRNLDDRGISHDEAMVLLRNDVEAVETELEENLPIIEDLNSPRQMVIVNMAFNLGVPTLLVFDNMIAALEAGQFDVAAEEMLDSLWAEQVGERAAELATVMRTGSLDGS
jgi:lysozyme